FWTIVGVFATPNRAESPASSAQIDRLSAHAVRGDAVRAALIDRHAVLPEPVRQPPRDESPAAAVEPLHVDVAGRRHRAEAAADGARVHEAAQDGNAHTGRTLA